MFSKKPSLLQEKTFINGEWIHANSNDSFDVTNPATGKVIGTAPNCGAQETTAAIDAAHHALDGWRSLTAKERRVILKKWHQLIIDNKEDLATLMTMEQGKPLAEARGEVDYGAHFIDWFADEALRVYGDTFERPSNDRRFVTIKQAIGVVAAITAWNFPCANITRKCSAALAAGCTVVVKPGEDTPFTALALAHLAEKAGFPAGVFNVITSNTPAIVGQVLTSSDKVRKLSFTGSTHVGKLLMQQSASNIKKLTLELGGNAPFIVFEDADIDAAVNGAMHCKFRNSGQTCVCANRIFVHEFVYDEFKQKFLTAVNDLNVGNGLDDKNAIGPLINEKGLNKVEALIKDALSKGAVCETGGKRVSDEKTFFQPTVLTGMTTEMHIQQEEIFGPVAALFKFSDEEHVVKMANDTSYGLAGYFYSDNINRIWRVAEKLEYGMVGINSGMVSEVAVPFGGVKSSGLGREASKYGIEEYLEMKTLAFGNVK